MKSKTLFALASVSLLGASGAFATSDYGPAVNRIITGCAKYYTTGYGHQFCVVHDIEGYYLTGTSYLQRCDITVSCHYTVNGVTDYAGDAAPGEISQLVSESYYSWHAGCWNRYSLATEHEGFVSNPAWFTEALYQASAGLYRHWCDKFGIAKDRNHIVGHYQWQDANWVSWVINNLGFDPRCNSHTDPGPYWDWSHYMSLIGGGGGPYRNLSDSNTSQTIPAFLFGIAGDVQLAGDWDGNGTMTPGVLRGNVWYLRNANNNGGVDITFSYGNAGDIPVVGDWDGNGTWTPGVFRGDTWYVANTIGGATAYTFAFGVAGDIPLAGDWDGNGTFTHGVYRPSNQTFYLGNSSTAGDLAYIIPFGNPGDVPLAGDWDGDGIYTVGLYRPSTAQFFLRTLNTGPEVFTTVSYGNPGESPIVGDWDGNGTTTIGLLRTAMTDAAPTITTQPRSQALNVGTNVTFSVAITSVANYQWKFNGANISGATRSSYTKSNVQSSDAGSYTVNVSNMAGSATSDPATLLVNTAPTLALIASRKVHGGCPVIVTASATDPEAPPQTLNFSLDAAPSGAAINAASGVFNWTPSAADAGTTNTVTVRVTDNGTPSQSAVQSFIVTVVAPVLIASAVVTNDTITLSWNAIPGQTYRVQYKDTLGDPSWTDLTDVAAAGETASFAGDLANDAGPIPQRFYRILVVN